MTHPQTKKNIIGLGLSEIRFIKKTGYATVVRHKKNFDCISDTNPPRYVFNEKIINWYPEYKKGSKKSKVKIQKSKN